MGGTPLCSLMVVQAPTKFLLLCIWLRGWELWLSEGSPPGQPGCHVDLVAETWTAMCCLCSWATVGRFNHFSDGGFKLVPPSLSRLLFQTSFVECIQHESMILYWRSRNINTHVLHTGAVTWPDPISKLHAWNSALENPSLVSKFMLMLSYAKSNGTALLPALDTVNLRGTHVHICTYLLTYLPTYLLTYLLTCFSQNELNRKSKSNPTHLTQRFKAIRLMENILRQKGLDTGKKHTFRAS